MLRSLLFTLLLCTCGRAQAQIQVDAKVNVGSLVTGGINVAGEVPVGERTSVALGLAFARLRFGVNDADFRYRTARLIPEFRYYFSPDLGADRFFAGGYAKAVAVRAEEIDLDNTVNGVRGVLGLLVGYKWVSESGFVVELNTGVGRGTFFGGGDIEDRAFGLINVVDLRLGVLAGYRF